MPSLILTLVGPDRPGLVRAMSERVADAGGSWLESRMARLGGQFAGMARIELPEGAAAALRSNLAGIDGMRVELFEAGASGGAMPGAHRVRAIVELVGQDRPGIVRDLTTALADIGANIEELATNVESGSFSGETMFRANATISLQSDTGIEALRTALERLGNEMMVDLHEADAAAAPSGTLLP